MLYGTGIKPEVVAVSKDYPAIPCSLYGEGCKKVYRIRFKRLIAFFAEYESEAHASFAAKHLKTYHYKKLGSRPSRQ